MFSESYHPTIHIFHSAYKTLLTNKRKKTLFQSSYRTILTFAESYYQIIMTFLEFMSNNKHIIQIELLLILRNILYLTDRAS